MLALTRITACGEQAVPPLALSPEGIVSFRSVNFPKSHLLATTAVVALSEYAPARARRGSSLQVHERRRR